MEVTSFADPETYNSTNLSDSVYRALNHTVSDGRIETEDVDIDTGYIVVQTPILGKYVYIRIVRSCGCHFFTPWEFFVEISPV